MRMGIVGSVVDAEEIELAEFGFQLLQAVERVGIAGIEVQLLVSAHGNDAA